MKLQGISCSEDLFVTVINSYRQIGWAEEALKMFYRISEFGCKPTVRIYNHVLDALLSENRFNMINPVYTNMKRDGLVPNVFTYNVLLKALCKNDRVDNARKLLVEMSKRGCSPDAVKGCDPNVHTFSSLIKGLFSEGRVLEALESRSLPVSLLPPHHSFSNDFFYNT